MDITKILPNFPTTDNVKIKRIEFRKESFGGEKNKKDLLAIFKELEIRERDKPLKKKWRIIRIILRIFMPLLEWKFKLLTYFKNLDNIELKEEDRYWLSYLNRHFIIQ